MNNKLPIIAFVFSLLFFVPFLPLIGLITGIVSLKRRYEPKGLAMAAVVIGAVLGILNLITSVGLIVGFLRGLGLL